MRRDITLSRDGQLRPIEAQQAIAGLAAARSLHLASVIDYNQAQLELLRAIGEPHHGRAEDRPTKIHALGEVDGSGEVDGR